jgi:[histone H3]-lysine36 N-trimethyltransferase
MPASQDGVDEEHSILPIIPSETDNAEGRPSKRSRYSELYEQNTLGIKPLGFSSHAARHKELVPVQSIQKVETPTPPTTRQPTRQDIQQIIIAASAAAAKAPPLPDEDGANGLSSTGTPSKAKRALTREEREANKEKRLLKLVGAVVVKCMSKYSKQMEHDMFKKHAKEVSNFRRFFLFQCCLGR